MTEANTSHKLCVRTKKTLGALRTAVQLRSAHEGVPTAAQELLPLLPNQLHCAEVAKSHDTKTLSPVHRSQCGKFTGMALLEKNQKWYHTTLVVWQTTLG